jgi:hypothetical protein
MYPSPAATTIAKFAIARLFMHKKRTGGLLYNACKAKENSFALVNISRLYGRTVTIRYVSRT